MKHKIYTIKKGFLKLYLSVRKSQYLLNFFFRYGHLDYINGEKCFEY